MNPANEIWGDPWLSEIRMMAGERPPVGWTACEGQALSVSEHTRLFELMGTAFGGDGVTSFLLPDMRGRVPVQAGPRHPFASSGGTEKVKLESTQLAPHRHVANGSSKDAEHQSVAGKLPAGVTTAAQSAYVKDAVLRGIRADSISGAGGDEAHENMQPFVCLSFAIATEGSWPTDPSPTPPPVESPFVGEVKLWGCPNPDWVPHGWLPCDGRRLPIQQNRALYAVLGARFGGDGATFQLPLLADRVPVGAGQGPGLTARSVGQTGGAERVTLTEQQMPAHNHPYGVSAETATERNPAGQAFGLGDGIAVYGGREGYAVQLAEEAILPAGDGKPHENMQPYMAMRYFIAFEGIFPYRT